MGEWGQCLKKCNKDYWIIWILVPNLWFLISPQWFAVDSEPDDLLLSDLYLGWKCVDLLFYFPSKCVTLSALDCLESCPLIKSKDTGIYKKYEIWNISCIHISPKITTINLTTTAILGHHNHHHRSLYYQNSSWLTSDHWPGLWLFLLALLFARLLRLRASRDQVPGINCPSNDEAPTCNVDVEHDLTIMRVRILTGGPPWIPLRLYIWGLPE